MDIPYQRIFNKSVERVILISFIFQPELIEDFSSEIIEDDFYFPFHRDIYNSIINLSNTKNIVTEDLIKEELEKRNLFNEDEFLLLLLESPVSKLDYYIKELKNKSTKRRLLRVAKNIEDAVFEQDMDSDQLLNIVEGDIFSIGQDSTSGGFKGSAEILKITKEYIEEMRSRDNREVIGVDTGFRTLNKMTTGFNNGDLIIVAARPSMGKTAFSLNMVYSALKTDSGVAFFSLEMPVEQLMLRLLSIDSLVELQKLRTGDLTDNEYSRLNQSIKNFSTKKLFIDDDGGLNINQLRTKLRKLKSKNPEISMAVVDYIQIMNSTNSKDRQAEISEISRGLKLLARELKIPIIALSQLNRSLESRNDKRPIMSDIRESGAIEQDADIILFIYRDDVYRLKAEKEKEMEARNRGEKFVSQEVVKTHEIAEIIIAKQRNGPTGVIKLNFHKSLTQFLEIENVNFDAEAQQPTRINMISDVQNIEPFDNVSDVDEASMPVF